jgi:very-short-patch-repair endonuclease
LGEAGRGYSMTQLKSIIDLPMYFGASIETLEKARALRKEMTPFEKLIWQQIRMRKLNGFKFRRQHPISLFIADFFCYEALLILEIDGSVHDQPDQKAYDIERTGILNTLNIKVLRFTNNDVQYNMPGVLKEIRKELLTRKDSNTPSQPPPKMWEVKGKEK